MKELKDKINHYFWKKIIAFNYWFENLKRLFKLHEKNIVGYTAIIIIAIYTIVSVKVYDNIKYNKMYKTEHGNYEKEFEKRALAEKENYELDRDYQVQISAIKNKVQIMDEFIRRLYPNYDYKSKIDDAFDNIINVEKLPTELLNIYIEEYKLKEHGLKLYQPILKNIMQPMNIDTSYVTSKMGVYGTWRPYSYSAYENYFKNVHEGTDITNYYDTNVYAIYDGIIYKKFFDEGGGWTVDYKILYEDEEGKKTWYYVRMRHLTDINGSIKEGDKIKKGDIIGTMGETGIFCTIRHLHIEIFKYLGNAKWRNINFYKNNTYGVKHRDNLLRK